MSNLEIWNQVKETDPQHTKHAKQRGGYTSIKPQYQIQEATKIFGPYGSGWGFQSIEMDYSTVDTMGLVMVKAVFFYLLNGELKTFPINNSWSAKMGDRIDTDFVKKAETNTMSKALSKLGFSADIYMGMFDDPNYVEYVSGEKAIENAVDKESEKAKQMEALKNDCFKVIEQIDGATSLGIVEGLYKTMVRKINGRSKPLMMELEKSKDNAKERLSDG